MNKWRLGTVIIGGDRVNAILCGKNVIFDYCGCIFDDKAQRELLRKLISSHNKSLAGVVHLDTENLTQLLKRAREWIKEHGHYAEDKGLIYLPLLREIDAAMSDTDKKE